ncbi:hypothetical protein CEY00_Acc07137 [Actinidia chinensis var. chinensis]|uniref:Uncharacterized protein n=1 Tax=Actinidia chinensis var. chinensis TaxID=1590841 RepID=A0A2R6RHN9_ACTCC|nr:hypothetical protein CEY00_Acc07137 [Actinidia chinensis var. chinensis]
MANHEDDLDLLLSLQDRVLETPPASPSTFHSKSPGYLSEDGSPKRMGAVDMSVFRNAVQDCLDYEPEDAKKALKSNQLKKPSDAEFEKFSGLRIRNQLVSQVELSNHFSEIRFVRLPAIKNVLVGDTLSGCWATVGVLTEKGNPRTSSTGKTFCIWKIGCLDEKTVSVFLFGDAYQKYSKEKAGTVLALFNCAVRKDNLGSGFSLSVYSAGQILKIGTSLDYGVCKGKRKDGMPCTLVVNKRHGIYCSYHRVRASEKYSITRTELKGGNLRTAFRDHSLKSEGIYVVDPLADRTNLRKPMQPAKLLSVEGLKRALSNAGKVTTNAHSQGIRFLTEVTGKLVSKPMDKVHALPKFQSSEKRSSSTVRSDTPAVRSQQTNAKRMKTEQGRTSSEKTKEVREKMIELDYISSDGEI